MLNEERRQSQATQRVRGTIQIVVCSLLAFVFIAAATATVNAPQAGAAAVDHTPSAGKNLADLLPTNTPTLTPTPTRASVVQSSRYSLLPQSIPGQPQVDANTIALYHFDSPTGNIAIDATGNYTGTMMGNATITASGVYAGALQLDGNGSYVSTGYTGPLSQGTIDAYVDFKEACYTASENFPIITAVGASGDVLELKDAVGLVFTIISNGNSYTANSGINPCRYLNGSDQTVNFGIWGLPVLWPYETWRFHHVAGTWGPRGMEIWVDGILHGVTNNDPNADIYPFPYMCNPQMQEMSSHYPVCQTPVMAPTSPAYPRGDYTGGLPSYNTFLIGADSSNHYFTGRIDEVRISNIQRTFSASVDPTITPTPTWTPVSPTGEYSVDSNTLALYHLNYQVQYPTYKAVLEEVTQQYKGLSGQAAIVPNGKFGGGLWLDGNGSKLNTGNLGPRTTGTVETWVKFANSSANQPIFAATEFYNSTTSLLFLGGSQGDVKFGIFDGANMHWVDSGVPVSSMQVCWHHLAGTWGPRGAEIWVDGVLMNTDTSYRGGTINLVYNWQVGCDFAGSCMNGLLDELRVSDIQRTFTPAGLRANRAALFSPVRTPYFGSTPAYAPDTGSGSNLMFLPFVSVAPTPACP